MAMVVFVALVVVQLAENIGLSLLWQSMFSGVVNAVIVGAGPAGFAVVAGAGGGGAGAPAGGVSPVGGGGFPWGAAPPPPFSPRGLSPPALPAPLGPPLWPPLPATSPAAVEVLVEL